MNTVESILLYFHIKLMKYGTYTYVEIHNKLPPPTAGRIVVTAISPFFRNVSAHYLSQIRIQF